jgi:alkanesulfonate monooxygenase SsuD/methylene tetrahydromethanopterin reductase-like flavin-dependent oxidoreductase (luciferase family)
VKVGYVPVITAVDDSKSDLELYQESMALADMAEPLGFDSLWSLEHHFTGYSMTPSPTQFLSYFAGKTTKIRLGTAVIVLPWHDPVRIAEEIALLDVMSGGRTLFGFGRGAGTVEYDGFRVPMDESRDRFGETAEIVRLALTNKRFSYDGKFFKIPETSIRPQPISHPEERFYASSVSPESAEMMARMGFGMMIISQKDWESAAIDIQRYRATAIASGHPVRPVIALANVILSDDASEGRELAKTHLRVFAKTVDNHYRFSDGHLTGVKGYEFYAKVARTYNKLASSEAKRESAKPADDAKKKQSSMDNLHVTGTPAQALEKLRYIHQLTGASEFLGQFSIGGLSFENTRRSVRLFAEKVAPVLKNDPAFAPRTADDAQAASA